jgi:hypothetical protein
LWKSEIFLMTFQGVQMAFIEALMGIVKQYEINMGAQNKAKI